MIYSQNWFDSNSTHLLILILLLLLKKTTISIIYLYSSITFKLNYQFITLIYLLLLYTKNLTTLQVVLIKSTLPLKFKIFIKLFNKALLYNKIAPYHIIVFLSIIYSFILNNTKKNKLNLLLVLTSITLLLGSIWSIQEVLWGGLWNWNLVELTLLLFFLLLVIISHNKVQCFNLPNLIIIVVSVYLYFNHIPLSLSNHNFVNNKFHKTNIFLILILFLFFFKNSSYMYIITIMWLTPTFVILLLFKESDYLSILKYLTLSSILIYSSFKIKFNLIWISLFNVFFLVIYKIINYNKLYLNIYIQLIHYNLVYLITLFIVVQHNYYLIYTTKTFTNIKPTFYSIKHIIKIQEIFFFNKYNIAIKNKPIFIFNNRKSFLMF